MSFSFSKDFIEKLIDKTDIIKLISSYIILKKKGVNHIALCPFHKEETPSFFVESKKKKYYCFGCGANGNIIDFLITYKKINFLEAINILSNKINLTLKEKNIDDKFITKANKFYSFMESISNIYSKELKKKITYKNTVSDYVNSRNINEEIIEKFNIGYSSGNIIKIFRNSYNNKALKDKLIFSGLISEKKNYFFERFKNRLIFPIRNEFGNIVGYSGRILDNKIKPKYINSPESIFFSKSSELYGLYELKKKNVVLDQVLVVEGYIDVITLHQFGIENVVATMGTILTKEHIKKLMAVSKEIIICFDGDLAGKNATTRSFDLFLKYINKNLIIKFLILEENHDPDSYIKTKGKQEFLNSLHKSINFIEFFFYTCLKNNKFLELKDKINLSLKISNLLCNIDNNFVKQSILNHFFYLFKQLNKNILNFDIIYKENINQTNLIYIACNILIKNKYIINNIKNEYYLSLIESNETNLLFNLIMSLKNNSNINLIEVKKNIFNNLNIEDSTLFDFVYNLDLKNIEDKYNFIMDLILINNLNEIFYKLIKKSEHKCLSRLDIDFLNKFIFFRDT